MSTQTELMNEQLLKETHEIFSDLYKTARMFINEQVDLIPFEGSWTPGQVMEHMLKAVAGIPGLCMGNTQPAQRPQDEKTEAIKKLFLDFSIKFKSPDFIEPTETQHDRNQQMTEFEQTEQAFADMISSQDLSLLCTDFDLPGFGQLTRYELLHFGLVHTQRHTWQLNNILKIVTQAQ
jgi:hypothetical protein